MERFASASRGVARVSAPRGAHALALLGPQQPQEAQEHARLDAAIDRWWVEFARILHEVTRWIDEKAPSRHEVLADPLHAIHEELMWEVGPSQGGGRFLAITPESNRGLRPLVGTLLQRAPRIPNWQFLAYRPPRDVATVIGGVDERAGVDISGATVSLSVGSGHRIDLDFQSPRIQSSDDRKAMYAALIATESLLGEEPLDRSVGFVSVSPSGDAPAGCALDALSRVFAEHLSRARDTLPTEPCWKWGRDDRWCKMSWEPVTAEEYPGRDDLVVAMTQVPDLVQAARAHRLICSENFSKMGERFLTVKIDGMGGPGAQVSQRSAITDALDETLSKYHLGISVGGGTGLRYAYIDFALMKAVPLVRSRLRELELPIRSWILPLDSDLRDEWVGVWDETPAPPVRAT